MGGARFCPQCGAQVVHCDNGVASPGNVQTIESGGAEQPGVADAAAFPTDAAGQTEKPPRQSNARADSADTAHAAVGDTSQNRKSVGDRSTVQARASISSGTVLNDLRIDKRLGRGGMGEVWGAHDLVGDRQVVVKVLPQELQARPQAMEQVKETFGRIHQLQHQHICPTYALGYHQAVGYYLVMKFLNGLTLAQHSQNKSTPLPDVLSVLEPVARALDYAHAQGVIHRDVKPDNIMVIRSNDALDVQLVDFGLAAQIRSSVSHAAHGETATGGTYEYMAPEQWNAENQDGRTDQYALAVVAFEMLAGHLPFRGPDTFILKQTVLHEATPRVKGWEDHVNAAFSIALAKDRKERFSTCREFIENLAGRATTSGGASQITTDPTEQEPRSEAENRQKLERSNSCPQCGTSNKPDDAFCEKCGAALTRDCPECARAISTHTQFCGGCGTDVATFSAIQAAIENIKASISNRDWTGAVAQAASVDSGTHITGKKGTRLLKQLRKLKSDAEASESEYEELSDEVQVAQDSEAYEGLLTKVQRLKQLVPNDSELNSLETLLQRLEDERQRLQQKADQLTRTGNFDEAIECLEQIHSSLQDTGVVSTINSTRERATARDAELATARTNAVAEKNSIESLSIPAQLHEAIRRAEALINIEHSSITDPELTSIAQWARRHLETLKLEQRRYEASQLRNQIEVQAQSDQLEEAIANATTLSRCADNDGMDSQLQTDAAWAGEQLKELHAKRRVRLDVQEDFANAKAAMETVGNSKIYLEQVCDERLAVWQVAAEHGDPAAQWLLADCYLEGVGVEQDFEQSYQWVQKAAEQGLARAQITLGHFHERGYHVTEDIIEAVTWYRRAAELKDPAGFLELARCHLRGLGASRNPKQAISFLELAVAQNYPAAKIYLAQCYKNGSGVEKDPVEMHRLFDEAAQQGNVRAQYLVGKSLLDGTGVEQDSAAALGWFEKAAELEQLDAMTQLELLGRPSGRRIEKNSKGMEFVEIKNGSFRMGSDDWTSEETKSYRDETPAHRVTITQPFLMSRHTVTQQQYLDVMGKNPSKFKGLLHRKHQSRPVERVSWFDAVAFCNALSKQEGLKCFYRIDGAVVSPLAGDGYRLPTEAEWEHACRGGRETWWYCGNKENDAWDYAWCRRTTADKGTHVVGRKHPNRFGLYDMHGNVWEWCQDWFGKHYYQNSPTIDPSGPDSGEKRLMRGGSWNEVLMNARSAVREFNTPDVKYDDVGFRVVRTGTLERKLLYGSPDCSLWFANRPPCD